MTAEERPADGPDTGFVAVVDESTPEGTGGIFYVVTAAILLAGPEMSARALAEVVAGPGRTRPFHWHTEGSTTRSRMIQRLAEIGACAHVHITHPVGRKKQEAARSLGLLAVTDRSIDDGASRLLIESRTADLDWRDGRTLAHHAQLGLTWEFAPKRNPLVWAADAVCGAVREHLLGDDTHLDQLRANRVVGELSYGKLT